MELMRGLAFVALLFAGSAVGAELRQAEVCGDGTTHQSGYCPAVLSSASCSATGATTGSCSATSDEADGTRYVCATSNNTALTGAEIEACSGGAAIAGSSAAETGNNSVSLSGLTTDAAHYGQIVNESPEGWYSNRLVSSSFTPSASGGTYDFSGFTIPFTHSMPSPPENTSDVNVNTISGFQSAVAMDNVRIIVAAGTYTGNIQVTGSDVDIVMSNSATVAGSITIGDRAQGNAFSRIRWTGGNMTGGPFNVHAVTDFLLDNFHGITDGGNNPDITNDWDGKNSLAAHGHTRVAIINSTMEMQNGSGLGGWALYSGAGGAVDFTIANVKLISDAQNNRIQGATRLVIVDSVTNPDNNSTNGMRLQYDCDQVFVADTTVIGSFQMNNSTGAAVTNGTFENVTRYYNQTAFASTSGNGSPNTGTVNDSTVYNLLGTLIGQEAGLGTFTGSNNLIANWNGTTLPDFSAIGADH